MFKTMLLCSTLSHHIGLIKLIVNWVQYFNTNFCDLTLHTAVCNDIKYNKYKARNFNHFLLFICTFHPKFSKNVQSLACPVVFPPQGPN